ncbi:unnamed protein product [Dibothriocephalus latus]|uniref:Uncharacterized protein n=1 Tax=Dibothriocephalus latus TaxID=60516 RepID=A0A3P7PDM0_DIBLA|nr:unnamed protein product [Dibothriocephalus latus]
MNSLKMEMEYLKKSPRFHPKEEKSAVPELERGTLTYGEAASLAEASKQKNHRASMVLGGSGGLSRTKKTVDP